MSCDQLAANLVETTYTHADPDRRNYYWVTACNRGGCSPVDVTNVASPVETGPQTATTELIDGTVRFRSLPNRPASRKYTGNLLSLSRRTACPATRTAQKRGEAVPIKLTSSPLPQSMRPTSRHRDLSHPACTTLESQWASPHTCFNGAMTSQPWIRAPG